MIIVPCVCTYTIYMPAATPPPQNFIEFHRKRMMMTTETMCLFSVFSLTALISWVCLPKYMIYVSRYEFTNFFCQVEFGSSVQEGIHM